MDDQTRACWENVHELPINFENQIRKHGRRTGSRVFGGFDIETSDMDILVPGNKIKLPNGHADLFDFLLRNDYGCYVSGAYRHDSHSTIYVKCSFTERPVNLIICNTTDDFLEWSIATDIMASTRKTNLIFAEAVKEKACRVRVFQQLRALVRDCIL